MLWPCNNLLSKKIFSLTRFCICKYFLSVCSFIMNVMFVEEHTNSPQLFWEHKYFQERLLWYLEILTTSFAFCICFSSRGSCCCFCWAVEILLKNSLQRNVAAEIIPQLEKEKKKNCKRAQTCFTWELCMFTLVVFNRMTWICSVSCVKKSRV